MSSRVLQTKRLMLRPLDKADASDIARLIGDWAVIQWLTVPPFPYSRNDAEWFVDNADPDNVLGIEFDGNFAGVISLGDTLGYWLGKPYWGMGLMTEAASAVIAAHFAHSDKPVHSSYIPGNESSRKVLKKLGFRGERIKTAWSRPLGREVALQALTLTVGQWRADQGLRIKTDRLLIRPFCAGDLSRFHVIAGQSSISRMMASIPHPLTLTAARDWISARQFRGQIPFCAAVAERNGPLVGVVGIGGNPVSTMYFIDPQHWGNGYACEAMTGFLAHMFKRFDLDAVTAAVNETNITSQRVLSRLGFTATHRQDLQSSTRLEADPVIMYRLIRTDFKDPR